MYINERIIIVLTCCVLIKINPIKEPILQILHLPFFQRHNLQNNRIFWLLLSTTVHHTKLYYNIKLKNECSYCSFVTCTFLFFSLILLVGYNNIDATVFFLWRLLHIWISRKINQSKNHMGELNKHDIIHSIQQHTNPVSLHLFPLK